MTNKPRTYKFTIPGRLPSLNDYTLSNRNNRYGGSKAKRDAEKYISQFIPKQHPKFNYPITVIVDWYEKDNRRDVDNVMFSNKFLLDALVNNHVITDDSRKYIDSIKGYVHTDRNNPRIEVVLLDCIKCRVCGEIKNPADYYDKSGTDHGKMTVCIECHKKESKERYHNNVEEIAVKSKAYREKNREVLLEKGREIGAEKRARVEKYKTPCVLCGEGFMPAVAFHHIDPAQKKFRPSQIGKKTSEEELVEEINKCICLCFNCHQKYHNNHEETVKFVDEYTTTYPRSKDGI